MRYQVIEWLSGEQVVFETDCMATAITFFVDFRERTANKCYVKEVF